MADFNWVEGSSNVKEIIKSISVELTTAQIDPWTLVHPANSGDILDKAILETTTRNNLKMYVQLERPNNVLNHILITIGTKYDSVNESIDDEISSTPARFAWYRLSNDVELFEWMPVQYWMSFNGDFANIILQGDASLDIAPYNHFLISHAYLGALESFEDSDADDKYNFGITVSSDEFPSSFPQIFNKYGGRTATCITDIGMLGTRTGTPFQAHLPKFSASWEFADKNFITSSQWTHKHHMSDIIVYHAYDRERGKLQNILIGDRSSIFHLDTLVVDKDTADEKQYIMFNINAPYSIINNSSNTSYGIALRKA